jgi:hypothetical protein
LSAVCRSWNQHGLFTAIRQELLAGFATIASDNIENLLVLVRDLLA